MEVAHKAVPKTNRMTSFIIALLMFSNAERVTPLQYDTALAQRAQIRAEQLCETKQWSHDGWRDSFKGYSGYWGENLARNFDSATSTHKALMKSPTHKANIVKDKYAIIGIGRSEKCNLTVELFASNQATSTVALAKK
mgnify:CR=1 FL=1